MTVVQIAKLLLIAVLVVAPPVHTIRIGEASSRRSGSDDVLPSFDGSMFESIIPQRFQVIGAGPAGLLAFIKTVELVRASVKAGHLPAMGSSVKLFEKRNDFGKYPEVRPHYSRSQVLRLDDHAIELLQELRFVEGKAKEFTHLSVYDRLFNAKKDHLGAVVQPIGFCLDEVEQGDVIQLGYDRVRFGIESGLFDSTVTYCHIQTKYLERALFEYVEHILGEEDEFVKEVWFGAEWKEFAYEDSEMASDRSREEAGADAPSGYRSTFQKKNGEALSHPFDVLISAQGACLGCKTSVRKQLLSVGMGLRGQFPHRADPARLFKSAWIPADNTIMSWGMTGYFHPEPEGAPEAYSDVRVYLKTWKDPLFIQRYGGPLQVRSFWNHDLHYIGLGVPRAVVDKFQLSRRDSEYAQDHYWKFWKMILEDITGLEVGSKDGWRKDPAAEYRPTLFPIKLFESRDNTALLPPLSAGAGRSRGGDAPRRGAIITIQGDEARLPNFVTFSGINWGFYGVHRGSTKSKTGCHGMYNMLKSTVRMVSAGQLEDAEKCVYESNMDGKVLSVSLGAKARVLATQLEAYSHHPVSHMNTVLQRWKGRLMRPAVEQCEAVDFRPDDLCNDSDTMCPQYPLAPPADLDDRLVAVAKQAAHCLPTEEDKELMISYVKRVYKPFSRHGRPASFGMCMAAGFASVCEKMVGNLGAVGVGSNGYTPGVAEYYSWWMQNKFFIRRPPLPTATDEDVARLYQDGVAGCLKANHPAAVYTLSSPYARPSGIFDQIRKEFLFTWGAGCPILRPERIIRTLLTFSETDDLTTLTNKITTLARMSDAFPIVSGSPEATGGSLLAHLEGSDMPLPRNLSTVFVAEHPDVSLHLVRRIFKLYTDSYVSRPDPTPLFAPGVRLQVEKTKEEFDRSLSASLAAVEAHLSPTVRAKLGEAAIAIQSVLNGADVPDADAAEVGRVLSYSGMLSRNDALVLGCDEFSFIMCFRDKGLAEQAGKYLGNQLPDWTGHRYCSAAGHAYTDEVQYAVCSNFVSDWFNSGLPGIADD